MLSGAHAIIYSQNAEADRDFLREVMQLSYVDAGDGWLIFSLPPAEIAVHPGEQNDRHELFFMCEDLAAFILQMEARNAACTPVQQLGWGLLTRVSLPGGGTVGIYQPRHQRPPPASV